MILMMTRAYISLYNDVSTLTKEIGYELIFLKDIILDNLPLVQKYTNQGKLIPDKIWVSLLLESIPNTEKCIVVLFPLEQEQLELIFHNFHQFHHQSVIIFYDDDRIGHIDFSVIGDIWEHYSINLHQIEINQLKEIITNRT